MTESVGLQFRVEAFNIFNRILFSGPDTFIGSYDPLQPENLNRNPNFGVFSGQSNIPRVIQFGLKVLF